MRDWCAKLPGQMLRIAGILAVCDGNNQIDVDSVQCAAAIAAWFTENAAVVFGGQGVFVEETLESLLPRFLDECTVSGKGGRVKTADLFERYSTWATSQGYGEPTSQEFVGRLRVILEVKRNGEDGNVVRGVVLKG
jgi:hypothetical protein